MGHVQEEQEDLLNPTADVLLKEQSYEEQWRTSPEELPGALLCFWWNLHGLTVADVVKSVAKIRSTHNRFFSFFCSIFPLRAVYMQTAQEKKSS